MKMANKAASPKGFGRRRSMVPPSFSKHESKRNLLTRRASTGNMPSNTRDLLDIPDKHRAILKKGIGHIRLSIEGSAFHKWLEYLAYVKFGDLTKKSRFILNSKYNGKTACQLKITKLYKVVPAMLEELEKVSKNQCVQFVRIQA